jgi:hypothetical protein
MPPAVDFYEWGSEEELGRIVATQVGNVFTCPPDRRLRDRRR